MKQKPFDPFKNLKLDPEEQEIEDAIGRGEYKSVENLEKMKKELQKVARNTIALRKNKNINIRVNESVLLKFRAKAMKEGIPYQTIISSFIHRYAHAS